MRNSLSFFFSSFHLQGGSLMASSWGHWHYRSVHWSCLCFLFPLSPSLHPSTPSPSLFCPPFFPPLLCLLILCATSAESPCLAITFPLTHLGFFTHTAKYFIFTAPPTAPPPHSCLHAHDGCWFLYLLSWLLSLLSLSLLQKSFLPLHPVRKILHQSCFLLLFLHSRHSKYIFHYFLSINTGSKKVAQLYYTSAICAFWSSLAVTEVFFRISSLMYRPLSVSEVRSFLHSWRERVI